MLCISELMLPIALRSGLQIWSEQRVACTSHRSHRGVGPNDHQLVGGVQRNFRLIKVAGHIVCEWLPTMFPTKALSCTRRGVKPGASSQHHTTTSAAAQFLPHREQNRIA